MAYKMSRLLEILEDGNWHETDQLCMQMNLSDVEMQKITDFLGKYDFAELDEAGKRVRINKCFKKILTEAT